MGKVHASLFSGFGAADLAAEWMGWDNAFWCEIDDFPRTVLGYWFPKSKAYGNIKETDFTLWRGKIDILTGGFPCQPFSVAGQRKGADDDRYLWPEMLRAIREIRPTWIVGENVGGIISMVQPGCETEVEHQASLFEETDKETLLEQEYVTESVCRSLEQEGYSVQPIVIPACAVGAPHRRDRIFFIAYRADAGVKSVQQEGKNGIYQFEVTPNSYNNGLYGAQDRQGDRERNNSHPAWKNAIKQSERCGCKTDVADTYSQMLQKRLKARRWQNAAEIRARLDNGTKRSCRLWYAPYAHQLNGYLSGFCSGRIPQFEASGIRINTDTRIQRCEKQCPISESGESRFNNGLSDASRRDWRNFPTQSPVCRGNDGLPFDVVRLTISLTDWCTGSIKGYGNAIVPQVMYEIFKAIETIQD